MGTGRRRLCADGAPQPRGRVTAVLTTCALLTLAGGCTRTTGADDPSLEGASWASAAEAYVAAFEASWSEGITNAVRFYAPDARVDERGLTGFQGGRAAFAQNTRDMAQEVPRWLEGIGITDTIRVTAVEPIYLSTTGLIHPVDNEVAGVPTIPMARPYLVGPSGITEDVFAGSAKTGQDLASIPMTANEPTVRAYLRAWAEGDPAAVRERYADDAELVDTIAGVTIRGAQGIAALATGGTDAGGLRGVTLRTLPGEHGPAWYLNGPLRSASSDLLVLLLHLPGTCPGPVAVQLRLDGDQRIVREERFHRVDALRRCLPPDQRPHGWWDVVALPTTPPVPRTGTFRLGTHEIAVWNGSGRHEGLLRWALQRFADAGLPPLSPSSVTFLPDVDDPWEAYGFVTGSNAADIGVPLPEPQSCTGPSCGWGAAAKHAMLHELAHLWLTPSPYYGPPDRRPARRALGRWAQAQGLPWDDQDLPWEQRAGERAAEILAWGLMDQPDRVDARLGNPRCAELARDFEALTLSTADPRACVPSEGGAP